MAVLSQAFLNNQLTRLLPLAEHSFLEGLNQDNAKFDALMAALVKERKHEHPSLDLRDLGNIGDWEEWKGTGAKEVRQPQLLVGRESTVEWRIDWHANHRDLQFNAESVIRDKGEQAGRRFVPFLVRQLISTHLEVDSVAAASTSRVLGGKRFFTTTGQGGHYGQAANVNSLTQTVASTAEMTADEWKTLHKTSMKAHWAFEDDTGVQLHPMIDTVLYLFNPNHLDGFNEAFRADLTTNGGTNVMQGGGNGFASVQGIGFNEIATTNVYFINTTEGIEKPFFKLRPEDDSDYLALNFKNDLENKVVKWFGDSVFNFGFNMPLSSILTVLST